MMSFDLANVSLRHINDTLQNAETGTFEIIHPGGNHSIAVGLTARLNVHVRGHVGYYCAGMNQNATIYIEGNAGPGLAENMISGHVHVKGNASQYCAATAHGGLVVVEGDASSRCGISLKGADIVIGGSVGHMSAFMAQSGRLVVLGDTGDALGDSIYEAQIYCKGTPKSLGADCIEKPMKDEHKTELAKLLFESGFQGIDISTFKRYGSARKLYNFSIQHIGEY
jgi:methylamine---glutamate N-methyltransferase subunit B